MDFIHFKIIYILIYLLFLGLICYGFYHLYDFNKNNNKYSFFSNHIFYLIKYIFLGCSLLVLLFAIFFSAKKGYISQGESAGMDIVFVLDVSKSMNVADVEASGNGDKLYTRLDLAKDAISHFVNSNPHNRYSLVIFAGEAIATLPLTQDHQVFLNLLQNVDYRNLTKQGSDFIQALESGVKRFFPDDFPGKALVFLSDGGDTDSEIEEEKILQIYKKNQNIFFLVLGIGTDIGGKIITNKDVFGRTEYQKYQGKYVLSSINEKSLMLIAQGLKSKYLHVTQVQDIGQIDDFFGEVEKKSFSKSMQNNEIIINRNLIGFSFIFFILYYFLHIFEMPLYYLIFQGYKK